MFYAANPLYITPHYRYPDLSSATALLHSLSGKYPAVRFGLVLDGSTWLVFRIHEQHQQGRPLSEPQGMEGALC